MEKGKAVKKFLIGTVFGGVLGAAAALLFAPKPGRELRQDIKEQMKEIGEATQRATEDWSKKSGEIAGNISAQATELAEKVKEVTGNIVTEIKTWRSDHPSKINGAPADGEAETTEETESR